MPKKTIFKLTILCISLLFVTSCSTASYYLTSVDTELVSQIQDRGKTYQVATTDSGIEYMAYAQPTYDGDQVQISIGIANGTNENFHFSDSSIDIFVGNYETGNWTYLGQWNANQYYQEIYNQIKVGEGLTAVIGVMSMLNSAQGSISTTIVSTPSGPTYIQTYHFHPGLTYSTMLATSAYMDSIVANNRLTQDNLQSSLLFSSDVAPRSSYIGNVYIPAGSSPEYKLTLTHTDGTTYDFIFSRSDRYSLLHPWSDKPRDRHSIIFTHSIARDRMQLTYLWSRKNHIGLYQGLSLYNITKASSSETASMGIPLGITYKILPNTWLTAGFDPVVPLSNHSTDNFFNFGLQVGLNVITNFLDFNLGLTYIIPKSLYIDLGAGIAF